MLHTGRIVCMNSIAPMDKAAKQNAQPCDHDRGKSMARTAMLLVAESAQRISVSSTHAIRLLSPSLGSLCKQAKLD